MGFHVPVQEGFVEKATLKWEDSKMKFICNTEGGLAKDSILDCIKSAYEECAQLFERVGNNLSRYLYFPMTDEYVCATYIRQGCKHGY